MSCATVLSVLAPPLVAPAGAPNVAERVRPAGMFDAMLAVIFAPVWFVVTAHELLADVAEVGALPAVAVLMISDGEPVTLIWLIASTWNVTVCVAVWADAAADATSIRTPAA